MNVNLNAQMPSVFIQNAEALLAQEWSSKEQKEAEFGVWSFKIKEIRLFWFVPQHFQPAVRSA